MNSTKKNKEIAAYATMVKSLDENVKRIIDYLDQFCKSLYRIEVDLYRDDDISTCHKCA